MFLVQLKTALVEATRSHFNALNPNPDFASTWVSIEFPREKQNYPGVWVSYDDAGPLVRAGISHEETISNSDGSSLSKLTRWRFSGRVSWTVVALTSLERDKLFDEVVGMIAFAGYGSEHSSSFKNYIESNDFIALEVNFDTLQPSGEGAAPGTPWGTDEILYDKTITTEVIGEFVSDPTSKMLVPLSAIQVQGVRFNERSPQFPDDEPLDPTAPPWSPDSWS